ncbi:MurR/RpiR family transcriptional regulator [Mesoplasma chauliocola]|uniref:MurR/RpiR family transcriptional regulator n=1 Tax=Mesoplasma chauliocola TaxID=216427 RepID=A0A249SME2_9MOLU|nr:MurR/RpiR family transcriptional regulator [Mesoplasma chauliocola]ASZ08772.1 MurR/RpiR family transcriptional regulator [Mesoplasma chauliocola]
MAWILERIEYASKEYKNSTYKLIATTIKNLVVSKKIEISQKELANLCFVSESTITQFSKYLGFSGFREFWFLLKKECENFENLNKQTIKDQNDFYKPIFSWLENNKEFINKITKSICKSDEVFIYSSNQMINSANFMQDSFNSLQKRTQLLNQTHFQKPFFSEDKKYVIIIFLSGRDNENIELIANSIKESPFSKSINIFLFTTENQLKKINFNPEGVILLDIIKDWPSFVHRNIAANILIGSIYSSILSYI